MNLLALIRRLGLAEVARRAGVSTSTLQKWIRRGPSARGRDVLLQIARRHLAAKKGYETKKRRERFPGTLPLPPEPYLRIGRPDSDFLSPEEVLPNRPPIETKRDLDKARRRAGYSGSRIINTNVYKGESEWVTVGAPMLEVNVENLANQVAETWRASRRTWVRAIFLIFRYIPHNPIYRGEMISKQGTWQDWWTSTATYGDLDSIRNAVEVALGDGVRAAESRVIWLEAMNIQTFDNKEDLVSRRQLMRRQLS